MLHEILEQPEALAFTLGRYANPSGFLPETTSAAFEWLRHEKDLLIVASGSSRHAGLAAELMFGRRSVASTSTSSTPANTSAAPKNLSASRVSSSSPNPEKLPTPSPHSVAPRPAAKPPSPSPTCCTPPWPTRPTSSSPPSPASRKAIPATKSFTTQFLRALPLLSLLAAKARGAAGASIPRQPLRRRLRASQPHRIAAPRVARAHGAGRPRVIAPRPAFLFLGRGIHYPIAREGRAQA